MVILDTNVISELMRENPNPIMLSWLDGQYAQSLYSTTVNEAEILYGISILPSGKRKNQLSVIAERVFAKVFGNRIVPFDRNAAATYAEIFSERRASGQPIDPLDAQIAAITRSRNAIIATRNTKDFANIGIDVIDPWQGS